MSHAVYISLTQGCSSTGNSNVCDDVVSHTLYDTITFVVVVSDDFLLGNEKAIGRLSLRLKRVENVFLLWRRGDFV